MPARRPKEQLLVPALLPPPPPPPPQPPTPPRQPSGTPRDDPQALTRNEPAKGRRIHLVTYQDKEFMAEILRHTETKIQIPPVEWPMISAARGLRVESSISRTGNSFPFCHS
ncbi:hypothetical protein DL771_001859 [Monosporascus sp. 5C6A]|nr:hypothetical protein DL771_001859 [Monosporascus sp. 5C6A]